MAESTAVIVGGGLGGLSAAAALAAKGVRVTLLEKGPRPGGCAVAFHRNGHAIDLALHVTAAGGPGQEFRRLADRLGLEVEFLRLKQGFHVSLGHLSWRLPNDEEALFECLAESFPGERRGLEKFRRDVARQAPVYERLLDPSVSRWRAIPAFLPLAPRFLGSASLSTEAYLGRFVGDRWLRALLFMPSVFLGIPPDEFPAVNYLMMFRLLVGHGMYTIAGGGQALTTALVKRLGGLGVEMVVNAEAERILVEGGRATGVLAADGAVRRADVVISAADLPQTVHRLVGDGQFQADYLENLAGLRPSLSVIVLNVGLDCQPADAGVGGHLAVVFPDADLGRCLREDSGEGFLRGYSVTAAGVTDPMAGSTVSMVTGADPARWLGLSETDYREAKDRAAREMMSALEKRFPAILGHGRVLDLATPRTIARCTGNPGGAIMGFADCLGMHRRIMVAARIPVRGLYQAGAWTDRLGGFLQCLKSGEAAAGAAARYLGR